jgi:hypothetical protein
LPKRFVLTLQNLDPFTIRRGKPIALTGISFVLPDPGVQRLVRTAYFWRHRLNSRPKGGVLIPVFESHPDSPLTDLR